MARKKGYIRDLDVDEDTTSGESSLTDRLHFQFNPAQITRGVGFTWVKRPIPGHSHQRMQAISGADRYFEFTLFFHLDDENKSWVDNRLRWLESLTHPSYNNDGDMTGGPHRVLFVMGDWIRKECIIRPFKYTVPEPLDPESLQPRMATVPLILDEFSHQAVGWSDVRR